MSNLWSAAFWRDAAESASKTAAQSAVLALGGGAANVLTLDWAALAGAAGGGALLSLLTSVASLKVTGTASLARTDGEG